MMPKKQNLESQATQSARFRSDAQKLIDAGELNPTDADAALERLVASQRKATPSSADPGD
jgi:hypothetical protein